MTVLVVLVSEKNPAPNQYDAQRADVIVMHRAPAFTHQKRRHGTVLWGGSGSNKHHSIKPYFIAEFTSNILAEFGLKISV